MSNIKKIIFLVIISIAVISAVVWIKKDKLVGWLKGENPAAMEQANISPTTAGELDPNKAENSTEENANSETKTYKNEKYGFTLEYPQNWTAIEVAPEKYDLGIIFTNNAPDQSEGFVMRIFDIAKVEQLGIFNQDGVSAENEKCAQIKDVLLGAGSYNAKEITLLKSNGCDRDSQSFSIKHSNDIYRIVGNMNPQNNSYEIGEAARKILQTLKLED